MGAEELRAFSCTFDICSLGARLIELHEVREQSSAIVTRLIACTHTHTPSCPNSRTPLSSHRSFPLPLFLKPFPPTFVCCTSKLSRLPWPPESSHMRWTDYHHSGVDVALNTGLKCLLVIQLPQIGISSGRVLSASDTTRNCLLSHVTLTCWKVLHFLPSRQCYLRSC